MDTVQALSGLYMPFWAEKEGQSQPLATALSLDSGKNLCHQHFLKICRTVQQKLPREQQSELPSRVLDAIRLEWTQLETGEYIGKPEGFTSPLLTPISGASYRLRPTG